MFKNVLLVSFCLVSFAACKPRTNNDSTAAQSQTEENLTHKAKLFVRGEKATIVVSGRGGTVVNTDCAIVNPESNGGPTAYICQDAGFGSDNGAHFRVAMLVKDGSREQRMTLLYSGRGGAYRVQLSCLDGSSVGALFQCSQVESFDNFARPMTFVAGGASSTLAIHPESGDGVPQKMKCDTKNLGTTYIYYKCESLDRNDNMPTTLFTLVQGIGDTSQGAGLRESNRGGYGRWGYSCGSNGRDFMCGGQ